MSTDDLTARARRWLTDALPHNPRGLVSELADEVDRLRAERDEWAAQWRGADDMFGAMRDERDELRAINERSESAFTALAADLAQKSGDRAQFLAERDAARAALGRVRALTDTPHAWVLVRDIEQALEGKPS